LGKVTNENLDLKEADLFKTGDTFTINDNVNGYTSYGENFFPNKNALNNYDYFPYAIDFTSVTKDEATIDISLI
ncbi:MAG: hypothetical protein WCR97_06340, partial [Bacilli bacterium]